MLNAIIEADRIELLAVAPVPVPVPTDSGRPHDIYRCPRCQTAMWSDYGRRPNYRFVRIGTLDQPAALPPDVHIFVRSKQPWIGLPADARAFEVFYELEQEWPVESLARRRAALQT